MRSRVAEAVAWLWLTVFFYCVLTGTNSSLPPRAVFPLLAITGIAWHAWSDRAALRELFERHRGMLVAMACISAGIVVSEFAASWRGKPSLVSTLPAQVWLPLCLPSLALFLMERRHVRALIALLCVVSVRHFIALPVEGVTGLKVSWHASELAPRESGPFHFQASGLALASYLFPGLLLPIFYLGFGPLLEARSRSAWIALAFLWLVPVTAVQSRSAFVGTLAAALFALVAHRAPKRATAWGAIAAVTGLAAFAYWSLFSTNKSGVDLRLAYALQYLQEALRWPELLVGHGAIAPPSITLLVPGSPALMHSHNDLIQLLHSSGAITLAPYLAFWWFLGRLVVVLFTEHRLAWPVCAVIGFLPNTITDVGYHQFEKAAFIVVLAAWCIALSRPPVVRP